MFVDNPQNNSLSYFYYARIAKLNFKTKTEKYRFKDIRVSLYISLHESKMIELTFNFR